MRHRLQVLGERVRGAAHSDVTGAALLVLATVVALVWANVGAGAYQVFWHTRFAITLGDQALDLDLRHWVNDALMMTFFFLVSVEVKRDFAMGELRDFRRATAPVVAAVAGLVVPAVVFLQLNPSGEAATAWGVVISTDTAFVVGLLAVFGSAIPAQLRAFLLTLAVVDDVGALAVIAFAYTDEIHLPALGVATVAAGALFVLQRWQVWRGPVYLAGAIVVWLAVFASGVHATIAGVVVGLLLPVFPPQRHRVLEAEELTRAFRRAPSAASGQDAADGIMRSVSVSERFHHLFSPAVTLVIVPLFALANAGVLITQQTLAAALASSLTWGIVAGLVIGKFVGVVGVTALVVRLRLGELGPGLGYRHVAGGALFTGIGFTISLFIVDLALDDPELQSQARLGVLAASLVAAVLGVIAFLGITRYDRAHAPARTRLVRAVDPARDHELGTSDAPLSLVEYGRLGDPDDSLHLEMIDEVRDHFAERLAYVFRHNTLGDVTAGQAAATLESAAAQAGALLWPMREQLARISAERDLDPRELRRAAVTVGVNLARLEEGVRRGAYVSRVHEDDVDAQSMGLSSTPRFFVDGEIYDGPGTASGLIGALEERLAAAEGRTP